MTFKHILFPILLDGAPNTAGREMERLARLFGSHVTLLHVFQPPADASLGGARDCDTPEYFDGYEKAWQLLQNVYTDLPEPQVQRVLLSGEPAAEIAAFVESYEADLVVVPAHSGNGDFERPVGAVATRLMRDSVCDLWFAGDEANGSGAAGQRVLCAVTLTEEAIPLLSFTAQLADTLAAEVRVVHSVPNGEETISEGWDSGFAAWCIRHAADELARVQALAETSFPVTISLKGVTEAVQSAEVESEPDLIVIGRGKSQARFGAIWTHAYSIIGQAHCSVLSHCSRQRARMPLEDAAFRYEYSDHIYA